MHLYTDISKISKKTKINENTEINSNLKKIDKTSNFQKQKGHINVNSIIKFNQTSFMKFSKSQKSPLTLRTEERLQLKKNTNPLFTKNVG